MSMIFVDFREKWFDKCNLSIEHEKRTLLVGDFIIGPNLNEPQLVIERKTFIDLHQSILDNRYREQKSRILESINDPRKIVYIIEKTSNNDQLSKQSKGAILNALLRDNINVIITESKTETLNYIILLDKKCQSGDFCKSLPPVSYLSKSNKALSNVYLTMLTAIPRVSQKIAKQIIDKYPTMRDLVNALELGDEDVLASITGQTLALTIKNCLI